MSLLINIVVAILGLLGLFMVWVVTFILAVSLVTKSILKNKGFTREGVEYEVKKKDSKQGND